MRFTGFMIIGKGEGGRWLKEALKDIDWCDEICVCLNNADKKTEQICKDFKCKIYYDNREWGKEQWRIKQDFFEKFVLKFNPEWIITKDADEIFDKNFNKDEAVKLAKKGGTGYFFYVITLYDSGFNKQQSFWNVRMWQYKKEWGTQWQKRNLHCGLYPVHHYRYANFAPFILKHYGLQSKKDRDCKVIRYKKYDPQNRWMRNDNRFYNFLNSKAEVSIFDEEEAHLQAVQYSENTYHKQPKSMPEEKKVHYFRRIKDGALIPVYDDQVDEHKKKLDNVSREPMFEYLGEANQQDGGLKEAPIAGALIENKIYYIGRFNKIYDEECNAKGFESCGWKVIRGKEREMSNEDFIKEIIKEKPKFVLMAQLVIKESGFELLRKIKELGIPTVSWSYDLYLGYYRENMVLRSPFYKADYVFTTDGGHQKEFKKLGINHQILRQGIPDEFYYKAKPVEKYNSDIVFVGGDSLHNNYRKELIEFLKANYKNVKWYGKNDTHEIREHELNKLYASCKIVIGDSVDSPHYWSNRIYETVGRGGFIIHPETNGLNKIFEYGKEIETYKRGDFKGLKKKIDYYLEHDKERKKIANAGFKQMNNYLTSKICKNLLGLLNGGITE